MFIATTRFSLLLPDSRGWNVTRDGRPLEEYKAFLYNEERLDFRIDFLTNISLPILERASEGYKFLHIIEYSESLPKKYINKLKELEATYEFIRLSQYTNEGEPQPAMEAIALEYFDLKNNTTDVPIGKFILDDDDCLSLNYFNIMNEYISSTYEGFYISAGKGVMGLFDEDYRLIHCTESYKPKINIGFINIGRYDSQNQKLVFVKRRAPHMSMDKINRVILDSREYGYFWSRHVHQDTRQNKNERQIERIVDRIKASEVLPIEVLDKHFGSNIYGKLQSLGDTKGIG